MPTSYWNQVLTQGLEVPEGRSLSEVTTDLTRMLGSTDPEVREGTACPTLATWIARGVYDDLLAGLGDGMVAGLRVGLGEFGTASVFRRSASVRILRQCIQRDNIQGLVSSGKVLEWGDQITSWYLQERDLRAVVPGQGWAHAVAFGADAIGTLAESTYCSGTALGVLLDVLADRMLMPVTQVFTHGEADHVAGAVLQILRRNVLPLAELEAWVERVAAGAIPTEDSARFEDPYLRGGNAEALLRSLYLQLSVGPAAPQLRSDLLLVLVEALRGTNPDLLQAPGRRRLGG